MNTNPAHEWREEIAPRFGSKHAKAIEHFIENLLDTHTAHLVERLEASKTATWKSALSGSEEIAVKSYNQALDQAIDIINNKTE